MVTEGALSATCASATLHDLALARQLVRMGTPVLVISLETDGDEMDCIAEHHQVDGLDVLEVRRDDDVELDEVIEWAAGEWSFRLAFTVSGLEAHEVDAMVAGSSRAGMSVILPAWMQDERASALLCWSHEESQSLNGLLGHLIPPGTDPRLTRHDLSRLTDSVCLVALNAEEQGRAFLLAEHLAETGVPAQVACVTPMQHPRADSIHCPRPEDLLGEIRRHRAVFMLGECPVAVHIAQQAMAEYGQVSFPRRAHMPAALSLGALVYELDDAKDAVSTLASMVNAQVRPLTLPPRIEEEAFLFEKLVEQVVRTPG